MGILGILLIVAGGIIGLIYGIQLILMAFRESMLWGLVYLFVPFGALVYVIKFWDDAKGPFLKSLICIPLYLVGIMLAGVGNQ